LCEGGQSKHNEEEDVPNHAQDLTGR
jgi:hypothetical protein